MADRRVSVGVDADVSPFVRGMTTASAAAKGFARELETTDSRLNNMVRAGLALAPALVPIGAVATPAIAGLASQLGAAAGAAGVAALAFNGIGDALGAVNDYSVEPTAANLEKMNAALAEIGPAGAEFVMFLDSVRPKLDELQAIAREGMFPGMQSGIEDLMNLMPEFESVVNSIATALGDLSADAGAGLNSEKWVNFIEYIDQEAAPTLEAMGHTLGNVAGGLASMMIAFDPLADDFTTGMVRMSESFEKWAEGLAGSEGFGEFVDYVQDMGPVVLEAFGAIANAFVEVAKAAAPVGAVMLPVIEGLADATATVAGSDLGPWLIGAAAGVNALALSLSVFNAANASSLLKFLGGLKGIGVIGVLYGTNRAINALEAASRDSVPSVDALAQSLQNLGSAEASRRLAADLGDLGDAMGRLGDPGIRQSAFDTLHGMGSQMSGLASAAEWAAGHLGDFGSEFALSSREARDAIAAVDAALASIVQSGGPEQAAEAFADLAEAQNLTAAEQKALLRMMPAYRGALDSVIPGVDAFARSTDDSADSTRDSTKALEQNIAAMRESRTQALAASDAAIAYEASLDDARKSLKENGKTLNITTEAGRANRTALNNIAASWNNLSDRQKNAKGAFKSAKDALYDQARAFGATKGEADRYVRKLLEIPPKRETAIELETSRAHGALTSLQAHINSLRGRSIPVEIAGRTALASGGPIPSPLPARGPYLTEGVAA